jgi:hypothetical protein
VGNVDEELLAEIEALTDQINIDDTPPLPEFEEDPAEVDLKDSQVLVRRGCSTR